MSLCIYIKILFEFILLSIKKLILQACMVTLLPIKYDNGKNDVIVFLNQMVLINNRQ